VKSLTTRQGGEVWTFGHGFEILDLGLLHSVWRARCHAHCDNPFRIRTEDLQWPLRIFSSPQLALTDLERFYREVRHTSERLGEPLSDADATVQSMPDPSAPVAHVSYFEADAFATWSGKRLPSEVEWEVTARGLDVDGNFLDLNRLRPKPASPRIAGMQQMFGDVWEWTRSPFSPLSALPRGRRVQWQVHVRAVRFAGRLSRDAVGTPPRELPQFLSGAHALAIRRTSLGGGRVAPAQSVKSQGETR
jgi:Sulfatase-modifying factor enzyme 1